MDHCYGWPRAFIVTTTGGRVYTKLKGGATRILPALPKPCTRRSPDEELLESVYTKEKRAEGLPTCSEEERLSLC